MQHTPDKVFMVYADHDMLKIDVYNGLVDLTSRVEWQDVRSTYFTIIDSEGNVYKWDDSKTEEYATAYNYTLISYRVDFELGRVCGLNYERSGKADEFKVIGGVLA